MYLSQYEKIQIMTSTFLFLILLLLFRPMILGLVPKNLDIIVANPIDKAEAGFGTNTNQAIFIDNKGKQETIDSCSKLELAHRLLDFVKVS